MALNIGESQAVYDLVRYLLSGTDAVPDARAKAAAETLIQRAHTTLAAGFTADQLVEWWPDNAVSILEDLGAVWLDQGTDEPPTLTEIVADIRAHWLGGALEDADLNAAGREALG